MNKVNYSKELDKLILKHSVDNNIPTLLLHSCCAPGGIYVLKYLSQYFSITLLYYNPNIFPQKEYEIRCSEQERLINEMTYINPVKFVSGTYIPQEFFDTVKGLEKEPEGGKRCFRCYELRLREAAILAKEGEFDYFATTLSISPLKNADKINEIGELLSAEYGVKHLPSDFKKKEGYKQSVELSKEYGLYRQNFCGCIYSKQEVK